MCAYICVCMYVCMYVNVNVYIYIYTHTLLQGPHKGHLWSCAFSSDQKYIVTTGHEGRVVMWELETMLARNKELMVMEGHHGPVFSVCFSNDGTRIVSCSSDR